MGNKLINIWFSKKHDSSHYVAFNQSNTISRNNYPTVYRIKRNIIVIIGRRNDWNSKHITHNGSMDVLWYEKFESSCLLLVIITRFICSMEGSCLFLVPGWDKKGMVDNRLTVMHDFFEIRISWIRGLPWVYI